MIFLSAGTSGNCCTASRTSFRDDCIESASSVCQFWKRPLIAFGLTLAVAEMHPTPPARMFANSSVSLPAK